MILDGLPYDQYIQYNGADRRLKKLGGFIEFLERKLGVIVMLSARNVPFGRFDLSNPLKMASVLQERGILRSFWPTESLPDEPPFTLWRGACGDPSHSTIGGASVDSDEAALWALLGEGLERYLWFTQRDYFSKPVRATTSEIMRHGPYIAPERFTSFSSEQREQSPEMHLPEEASYLWVQGMSLVSGKKTYVPAQTVSAAVQPQNEVHKEPLIREQSTIGLATWPTLAGARLAGTLEIIEREAYMVMWFNQLTLPRIALSSLREKNISLDILIGRCERYRLKVHAVRMITDAPTHAICAIIEDESGCVPRFAFGLKAHRSLAVAVEKATLEALRARRGVRHYLGQGNVWDQVPVNMVGHRERLYYWATKENASRLDFLVRGEERDAELVSWEQDSPGEHLERVVAWCREKYYECVSVSLGSSKMNLTPWYVEMVVMPDLQPTHLNEWKRHLGGERLKKIPRLFGYTPREEPFIADPHPYS